LSQENNSELVVEGLLGDVSGRIVIDTGAQVSLIDIRSTQGSIEPTDIQIRGITGTVLNIYGQVKETLTLDGIEITCTFIVTDLPNDSIAILGYDILRWKKAIIDLEENALWIAGRKDARLISRESPTDDVRLSGLGRISSTRHTTANDRKQTKRSLPESLTAYCRTNLTVPARSEMLIQAKISKIKKDEIEELENRTVITEPLSVKIHGLYVARSFTKIINGNCWTKVVNTSPEELTMYKNTAVCMIHEPYENLDDGNTRRILSTSIEENDWDEKINEKLSHLKEEEQIKIKQVLLKYKQIFNVGKTGHLGCTSKVMHKINTGNHPPINKRPYRVPQSQRQVLQDLIQDQLDKGIIVPSTSPWSAPVVIVPKKPGPDGIVTYRMCIDFRELNKCTVPEVYPIPDVHETLDSLGGSKFFTALDMNSGFFQVKMHPDSQEKTAFSTPDGHYEYTRMPMGNKFSISISETN